MSYRVQFRLILQTEIKKLMNIYGTKENMISICSNIASRCLIIRRGALNPQGSSSISPGDATFRFSPRTMPNNFTGIYCLVLPLCYKNVW